MQAEIARSIPMAPFLVGYAFYLLTLIVGVRWWLRRSAFIAVAGAFSAGDADRLELRRVVPVLGMLIVATFPMVLLLVVAAVRS
jgi:hypothetical protein